MPIVLIGTPDYTDEEWRRALLWVTVAGIIGLAVHDLVEHFLMLACAHVNLNFGSLVSFRWNPHRGLLLTSASVLSLLALFLNPIGIKQLTYPINVMFRQPAGVGAVSSAYKTPASELT